MKDKVIQKIVQKKMLQTKKAFSHPCGPHR